MQENILTVILIIAIGILISTIYSTFCLRKLKRKSSAYSGKFDDRYLDLNLKFQLILSTIIMASIVIAAFGWNVKSQIVSELRNEVRETIKYDLDSLENSLDRFEKDINEFDQIQNKQTKELNRIAKETETARDTLASLGSEVEARLTKLRTLLSIYVVADLPATYDWSSESDSTYLRYYFSEMNPINATKLPIFKKPPIVNVQSLNLLFAVYRITTDYVDVAPYGNMGRDTKLTFWIVQRL